MAFLNRLAPNGQTWSTYCRPVPPAEENGRLVGAWGECMNSAVVFEKCNQQHDGPAGQVIEFAEQCGYGSFCGMLEESEGQMHEEMDAAQGDPFAFMQHRAFNGQTWREYCERSEPIIDNQGFVVGAWGDCMTAAVIFEHQNPNWEQLPNYMDDGPAGQVINFFQECGHDTHMERMDQTEGATHEAIDQGRRVPVYEYVYQAVTGTFEAPQVGEAPPQMTGRKKAFLVGCNYPGTKAELRGCINDVHTWKQLLTSQFGFEERDMVILTDDQGAPERQPTLANIRSGLSWLAAGAQPGDVLFWQYSGHGTQVESKSDNEADGLDEALCPCDYNRAGVLVDDEIFDRVVTPLQSGVKLTIILDCCHSGTAVDLPFIWEEGRGWELVGGTSFTAGDVQMFSGCQDDQCSMDASSGGKAAGAMTSAMTTAIYEDPDRNYPDMLQRLHEVLEERGYEQYPRLTSSQQFDPSSKRFSLCEGAIPNQNPTLGHTGPPRHHQARPNNGADECMQQ